MKISLPLTFALVVGSIALTASADPAANWTASCSACHGADGAGHTRAGRMVKVRDLSSAEVQKGFTDAAAFDAVKNGLQTSDGVTQMRPFKDKFSDADIKALVAYVRTLAK
jgi:cytochrome c553